MNKASRTITAGILAILVTTLCVTMPTRAETPASQVLFVCEHGNVKSLMAASYFNRLAQERGLRFRGVSRGSAPDSTTVPAPIVAGLRAEGFDVSAFHPVAVSAADVTASHRVITISTALPANAEVAGAAIESWTDVPAASVNYNAASDSLKRHVQKLVDELARAKPK
jgi:protein-tyrosine-phosphatase